MNASSGSTNREQPSIINLVDSLNESSTSEDSYVATDDSQPVMLMAVSRGARTINLEDEPLIDLNTPPTSRHQSTASQDKSRDPLTLIGRCWKVCIRQAELQKAQIDLLKQEKLKEKTEFELRNTELKKELEIYKQKCIALKEELQIVREHQYASGSSSEAQHQSVREHQYASGSSSEEQHQSVRENEYASGNSNEEQYQSQRNDLISKSTIFKSLEVFTCCICNELLIKPGVTNCHHTFCVGCLDKWRVAKKDCPVCRTIITNVHVVNEIDEYITSIVGSLSDEAFAERLQIIEDRSSAHSTVPPAPVKRQKVMLRRDLLRNEEDDDSDHTSLFFTGPLPTTSTSSYSYFSCDM